MLFVQCIPTSAVHRFKWDRSSLLRRFDWWTLKLINDFGVSYFLRARLSPEWRLNPGFGNQKKKNSWANKISCLGLAGCHVLFFCRYPVPFMSFIGYRKRLEELAWGFEPIRNGEIFSMNKYFKLGKYKHSSWHHRFLAISPWPELWVSALRSLFQVSREFPSWVVFLVRFADFWIQVTRRSYGNRWISPASSKEGLQIRHFIRGLPWNGSS